MNYTVSFAIPAEVRDSAAPITGESMALTNGDGDPLVIPVSIGGTKARALLDCGATRSLVDSRFAARHGIKAAEARRVIGFTGAASADLAPPLEIAIGSVRLQKIAPLIFDLEGIVRAARTTFEAVLGRELFLQTVVTIDPEMERLQIAYDAPADDEETLAVTQSPDRHFCIEVELRGGLRGHAVVDLGSTVPMYVSSRFAQQHNLFVGLNRGSSAAMGVEGIAVSQLGTMPLLKLGNLALTDIPFAVPPRWTFQTPVVLGLPVFKRFHSQLDFGRGRLRLRHAQTVDRPFARDRTGLSVIPVVEGLRVVHVAANSPGARAGLVPGDVIIAIDDGGGAARPNDSHRGLSNRAPGTRFLLIVKGKRIRELVLADYF